MHVVADKNVNLNPKVLRRTKEKRKSIKLVVTDLSEPNICRHDLILFVLKTHCFRCILAANT